jgi:hypothetical protein
VTPFSFAQFDPQYDESVHIFRTAAIPGEPIISDERKAQCNAGLAAASLLPFGFGDNSVAARVQLQSVHTKKINGIVKKPIRKIGEALVCQDWDAFPSAAGLISYRLSTSKAWA